jgi:predicted phage tail protein
VVAKYNPDGTPQWAVWDDYAGGQAIRLGAGNTIVTLGWGYLVTTHYTQRGLPDLRPNNPTNLSGFASLNGSSYEARLNFIDNANNEFWVEAERCTGSGCTNFSKVAQSRGENATGLADPNLAPGLTYTYRVRALGFMGLSTPSNTVEIVVPALNPPVAPSNLTAAMSGVNVVLNWQDNSTNESLFQVERCQGTGCASFIWLDTRGAGITTLTDANVTAGQSYTYRVRANNSNGYSSYSNIATIITPGGSSPPAAPSNLTAKALNKSQIKLTWTNKAANQAGVKVERCKGSTCMNFVQITTVAGTATTYTDSVLAANTAYRYRVRAYNSAGNSPYSNISSVKTLKSVSSSSSLRLYLPILLN